MKKHIKRMKEMQSETRSLLEELEEVNRKISEIENEAKKKELEATMNKECGEE